ncbi:MAG: hypothetical protein AAF206_13790 [Bacteroidota bacterium]
MKVNITKRHIKAARLSQGRLTPVELAVNELDCFEEIAITENLQLDLDGMRIALPNRIRKALNQFEESGEMSPLSFDLSLDDSLFQPSSDSLFEMMDDGYNF